MATGNAQKRITETTLKTLKAKREPWVIRDTEQRGFQVKVLPSGLATFQVEARMGGKGKVKKFKIGNVSDMPLKQAREKAKEQLNLIRSGTDPQTVKKQQMYEGMTLGELLEAYLGRPNHNLKERTVKDYRAFFKKQFKQWHKKRVVDITKYEILDWYTKGKQTPTFTHNAFRALNALMNYAIGLEVIEVNPCEFVTKNKVRYRVPKRTGHIEANYDLPKFLKAFIEYDYPKDSQKVARDMIILMLMTGLRFGEASSIKSDYVDLEKKILRIPDTKNRQDHYVPLVPLTFTMLRYRLENDMEKNSPYIFRIKGGITKSPHVTDIRKTLHGICDNAGIKRISSHDLRRTFASTLNNIGVGYADMQALMNHKSKHITAIYIQDNIENLRQHMVKVVEYYDLKIRFDTEGNWSKVAKGAIQANLYGNIQPDFEPLEIPEYDEEHKKSLHDDYWYGLDEKET